MDRREIVESVFTPARAKSLWTANYYPVLPFAPQSFDIGGVLPAMLYMFRWGHRRGRGSFRKTFAGDEHAKSAPSVSDVARTLIGSPSSRFEGFSDSIGLAVLGDLLLTWCLENRKHVEGREEPILRAFPTHYLMSWIDLPHDIANLRAVPETLVALLADQNEGEWLEPGRKRARFAVGAGFEGNALLAQFGRYMRIRGDKPSNLASDEFVESEADGIGIDELLAVRMAQACGSAPYKARGRDESERIPNRRSLAERASRDFREDLSVFIQVYGPVIPRHAFLRIIESGIGLGLANILLSTGGVMDAWEQSGRVPDEAKQVPSPVFVDCGSGVDRELRSQAEGSFTECLRRYERLPILMMLARVLDDWASHDRVLKADLPARFPDATSRMNLLGDVYRGRHGRSEKAIEDLEDLCSRLASGLLEEEEAPDVAERLRNGGEDHPALRLAESICALMGEKQQRERFVGTLEGALLNDRPNGLAATRRVSRVEVGGRRGSVLRSIVLTHSLLDYVVHRHLRKATKGKPPRALSLRAFLDILRDRYGLYVDDDPPGQRIPRELLLRNKALLERRLRDLGLLRGVNDAESMKQLRQRYGKGGDETN